MTDNDTPKTKLTSAIVALAARSKLPLAALVVLGAILLLAGCGLDQSYLDGRRNDLHALCEGAVTDVLRYLCESLGIDVGPKLSV